MLVGIKFSSRANVRDGTLLVCLALFLAMTQFFYVQTIVSALVDGAGAAGARRRARRRLRSRTGAPQPDGERRLGATGGWCFRAFRSRRCCSSLFPRLAGPLWGTPLRMRARGRGLSDSMTPGIDQRPVAFR